MTRLHAGKPPLTAAVGILLTIAAAAAAAGPEPAADREAGEERWYVLELGGRSAGWAVERWWSEGGETVTEAEMSLRVARGDSALEIVLAGRFVETAAGEPVSLRVRRALGSEPIETTYRFRPGRIEAETVQGGRPRREVLPLPKGEWLTPGEARRAVRRHHRSGDASYRLRAIDPIEGLEPITVARTRLAEDGGAPDGAGGRWREELSSAPGMASIVELDADGGTIRSTTAILGLEAVLRRSEREEALAAGSAAAGLGPEVLRPTLIRPDRAIRSPERTVRARYELSLAGGGELPDLPAGGGQRVERRGERLRVQVTVPGVGEGGGDRAARGSRAGDRLPPIDQDGAPDLASYLAASAYLDHDHPEIQGLLALALTGGRRPPDADPVPAAGRSGGPAGEGPGADDPIDAVELAGNLTALVRAHVATKDLDTGFATASEVARTGSGDCTEHSVLLAALLRAAGIPSRAVTGLVYLEELAGVEGVFGYHMWVQAWADGGWLDLDPTLPGGFDATHIALGTSALAGPEAGFELDPLLALVGRLEIRVLELEP